MNRQPKAAGTCALALALLVTAIAALPAVAEGPGSRDAAARTRVTPWEADAELLARTAPEAVEAGSTDESCTGWRSTAVPPPTIRVLRTMGPAAGTVQELDFRTYVTTTFGAEWQYFYPLETLKAGSIAVKQYGWYYTIVYRGQKTETGECYDVEDDTTDQYYQPELRTPHAKHYRALDATWHLTLRKWQRRTGKSRFFLTGYRQGSEKVCGADANGWKLYQHSALWCGKAGMKLEEILRVYLDPNLEIVDRGAHDVLGLKQGDGAHLRLDDVTGTLVPTIHPVTKAGILPAVSASFALDAGATLDVASVDVSGDGADDLVALASAGATAQSLSVAVSNGAGYEAPVGWWGGETGLPSGQVRLLTEDFDADGRQDVGLFGPAAGEGTASLVVLRGGPSTFRPPATWWSGALDLATTVAWAGDATGDGRGDLLLRRDLGDAGLEYHVAPSLPSAALGDPVLWNAAPDLRAATTRTLVGDHDRDGRSDLWLVTPTPDGVSVAVLRARATRFARKALWTSSAADALVFERIKLGSADVDYDGRSDLLLYRDRGARGTRLVTLKMTDAGLVRGFAVDDAQMRWEAARIY